MRLLYSSQEIGAITRLVAHPHLRSLYSSQKMGAITCLIAHTNLRLLYSSHKMGAITCYCRKKKCEYFTCRKRWVRYVSLIATKRVRILSYRTLNAAITYLVAGKLAQFLQQNTRKHHTFLHHTWFDTFCHGAKVESGLFQLDQWVAIRILLCFHKRLNLLSQRCIPILARACNGDSCKHDSVAHSELILLMGFQCQGVIDGESFIYLFSGAPCQELACQTVNQILVQDSLPFW